MKEKWENVVGYEGYYRVSTFGRIRSMQRVIQRRNGTFKTIKGCIRKTGINPGGYPTVVLCRNGNLETKLIHRLVAQVFIPNPKNKPEVNHKDEDKTNNKVTNLEWVTSLENTRHSQRTGKTKRKLTEKQVVRIRKRCALGIPKSVTADLYNVSTETVFRIHTRKSWKHVP